MFNLDRITDGYFQKTSDGRLLFYPWGALGRGYVVPSEPVHTRLKAQLKVFMIVLLAVLGVTIGFNYYVVGFTAALAMYAFYAIWVRLSLVRNLTPAADRMRLREAMVAQAMTFSATALWLLVFVSLGLAGLGAFVLWIDPVEWAMATLCLAMFLPAAVFFIYMIMLRREGLARGH